MSALAPYQQRVVDEKSELDSKLVKLDQFFESVVFTSLPVPEKQRLYRQQLAMCEYSTVLGERIAAFQ